MGMVDAHTTSGTSRRTATPGSGPRPRPPAGDLAPIRKSYAKALPVWRGQTRPWQQCPTIGAASIRPRTASIRPRTASQAQPASS